MRAHGPIFRHLYKVDEDEVLETWTLEKFTRYKRYALARLKESRD